MLPRRARVPAPAQASWRAGTASAPPESFSMSAAAYARPFWYAAICCDFSEYTRSPSARLQVRIIAQAGPQQHSS